MKTIILMLTIPAFLLASAANENLQWVDKQIEAIKPERNGLLKKDINSVRNPFALALPARKVVTKDGKVVMVKPPSKIKPLKVQSIINNRAMINNKWYRKNDKLREYHIEGIDRKSVLLKNKRHELKLFVTQKSANSKIKINKE